MEINKKMCNGFTLIEMLVVVLIIGILAAIALPQYNKTVEKTKYSEAIINIKAIENSINRHILAKGCSSFIQRISDLDVELSGGELDDTYWGEGWEVYKTKDFVYTATLGPDFQNNCSYEIQADNIKDLYSHAKLDLQLDHEGRHPICFTNLIDKGRSVCKHLESFGWEYTEDTF